MAVSKSSKPAKLPHAARPLQRDLHDFRMLAEAGVLLDAELAYWRDGDTSGLIALLLHPCAGSV